MDNASLSQPNVNFFIRLFYRYCVMVTVAVIVVALFTLFRADITKRFDACNPSAADQHWDWGQTK